MPAREGGILREHRVSVTDPYPKNFDPTAVVTTPLLRLPAVHGPSIAFVDPPPGATDRQHLRNERPVSSSARTLSCPSCTSPVPLTSDASETSTTTATTNSAFHRGTPSLSHSETENSDPATPSGWSAAGKPLQCGRYQPQRPGQHISLLSAALVTGDNFPCLPLTRSNTACGILRKEIGGHLTPDAEGENTKVSFAGEELTRRSTHFIGVPPQRHFSWRRVSLPPPMSAGPRLSFSPEHYSEGPESPPRPVIFDAHAHANFLPRILNSNNQIEPAESPKPRRRTLVFRDAEGVEERAKARQAAALRSQTHSEAEIFDMEYQQGLKVHQFDLSPAQTRSISPTRGPVRVQKLSELNGSAQQLRHASSGPERKLKFAASPNELTSIPRGRLRRVRPRATPASLSASSDEERPYVDSVEAGSQSNLRQQRECGRHATRPSRLTVRTASPAPKKLGGPEKRRASGNGRARSPAPKGRVALPESLASSESEQHSVHGDELDYEEDDEDDDDGDEDQKEDEDEKEEEDEDLEEDEDQEENEKQSQGGSKDSSDHTKAVGRQRSSGNGSMSFVRRASSPHPSVDSISHPAAFSPSDFEDDGSDVERITDRDFAGLSSYDLPLLHNRQRSPAPLVMSFSNHGSPFTRSRMSTPAISDAEGMAQPSRSTPGSRKGFVYSGRTSRPSISPVCFRSVALAEQGAQSAACSVDPRSFSSAALTTSKSCVPSVMPSPEHAHGGLSSSPQYALANSPDAWSALRSCLESAILADGDTAPQGSDTAAGRHQGNHGRSAFSTPGLRSTTMSTSRLTDLEEDHFFHDQHRLRQKIGTPFVQLQSLSQALDSGGCTSANLSHASSPQHEPTGLLSQAQAAAHSTTANALGPAAPIESSFEYLAPLVRSSEHRSPSPACASEISPPSNIRSKPVRILSSPSTAAIVTSARAARQPCASLVKLDHLDLEAQRYQLKKHKAKRKPFRTSSPPAPSIGTHAR